MKTFPISQKAGRGHACPTCITIMHPILGFCLPPKLRLSCTDSDAIPFILFDNGEEPALITGSHNGIHTLDELERKANEAKGIRRTFVGGCLWKERNAMVFKETDINVSYMCILEKYLRRFEDIDICGYTLYSEKDNVVYVTTVNDIFAEEKKQNRQKAIYAIMHEESCYTKDMATKFIDSLEQTIPNAGTECFRFLPFIANWIFREEKTIDLVKLALAAIEKRAFFNKEELCLSFDEILEELFPEINSIIKEKRKSISAMSFIGQERDYSIIPIHTFKEAEQYRLQTEWSITRSASDFQNYTKEGQSFFFCLKKGYEELKYPVSDDGNKNDYGLSMLAVSVNRFGLLSEITNRRNNPLIPSLDEKGLSALLGADFFSVMKPFPRIVPMGDVIPQLSSLESLSNEECIDKRNSLERISAVIPTSFHEIDDIISGWKKREFVVIAGRPSMGKTSMILSLARNISIGSGISVGIFSLELPTLQFVNRFIQNVCEIPGDKIRDGKLTDSEWASLNGRISQLQNAPIYIDDTSELSVADLRMKAQSMTTDHGVKIILVDYMQLINVNARSREEQMRLISSELKNLAEELNIPIIAVSQLNRYTANSRFDPLPQLSKLGSLKVIEQFADMICFIHRPGYYHRSEEDTKEELHELSEFIIAKNNRGPLGKVSLPFTARFGKFN